MAQEAVGLIETKGFCAMLEAADSALKAASVTMTGYEAVGSGPAIVFAHGLGGNQMSWWQQVAHFAPRWTCVTFAHRGLYPSSAIDGGPDPADYADDLNALVSHL